jgi:hypothetical protein
LDKKTYSADTANHNWVKDEGGNIDSLTTGTSVAGLIHAGKEDDCPNASNHSFIDLDRKCSASSNNVDNPTASKDMASSFVFPTTAPTDFEERNLEGGERRDHPDTARCDLGTSSKLGRRSIFL